MNELLEIYQSSQEVSQVAEALASTNVRLRLKGMAGSLAAAVGAAVHNSLHDKTLLFVAESKERAYYLCNDMEALFGETDTELSEKDILLFPSSSRKPYHYDEVENSNMLLRSEVMKRLNSGGHPAVITYPEALSEKVASPKLLETNTINVSVGESLSIDDMVDLLDEGNFVRTDFVVSPGQYALRGGIIDVFSFSSEHPFRIEFFGENVESVRTFDPMSQLSIQKQDSVSIIPDIEHKAASAASDTKVSLLQYLTANDVVFVENMLLSVERIGQDFHKAEQSFGEMNATVQQLPPKALYSDENEFLTEVLKKNIVEYGQTQYFIEARQVVFDSSQQPPFNKQFEMLVSGLKSYSEQSFTAFICVENERQRKRLEDVFEQMGLPQGIVQYLGFSVSKGFIDSGHKVLCFTDHEIFERYHKYKVKDFREARESLTMKELFELKPGDYITHIDYGVGRFSGLEKIEVNGKTQEAIRLIYKDNSMLYISIHSLHKISRYVGKDGVAPVLNRLGSPAWQALKQKTKQRVKDIAKDLIKLYAQRKASKGFAFSADSYLQNELEASFLYEDTPDQYKATRDVKHDMESSVPMDRLVCGDVGFGKTEVAIRAAFKAVCDSKQVAVLVPTTILALQHYNTFCERLKGLPCNIEYINRFKTTKQKTQIYKALAEGKIDILIGTHAITNAKVKFKDLGLLIIDEEQKFGVSVKEKLRQMKVNVDSLTLTATPIPRTLQFSLMGARDLSVINTAPPNRQPIETDLEVFSEETVRDAILYEMSRGGQVFFVSNRVENLDSMGDLVRRLVPDARIAIGHGQMEGEKLERVLMDFIAGDIDVLVATTIVENGLDIPNANTIIINDAQNFGLSDLHQLRGRVGRSNKKAFCYLLVPSFLTLTEDAQRRLRAIEEFSGIGSGFGIAMRDLDIRGAGNILGAEQSGFISEIGYDMYQKILNEALDELRANEFRYLYADEMEQNSDFVHECQIQTDLEVLIPDDYVSNIRERVSLYKELNDLVTDEELEAYKRRLQDRFGPLPKATEELVETIKLRRLAKTMAVEKLILRDGKMTCNFVADTENPFYKSDLFGKVIRCVQRNPESCHLKESKDKLTLTFDNINSIAKGISVLEKIV
ncbi:MAG: transcription-repair coupling factor [Bacteroidales bacterium]|nr:transcription-repair coupling factor [Bacteroidales bacterium]